MNKTKFEEWLVIFTKNCNLIERLVRNLNEVSKAKLEKLSIKISYKNWT